MATGKSGGKAGKAVARVISVKLMPDTIARLKQKAKREQRTAHAIMREAIIAAAA